MSWGQYSAVQLTERAVPEAPEPKVVELPLLQNGRVSNDYPTWAAWYSGNCTLLVLTKFYHSISSFTRNRNHGTGFLQSTSSSSYRQVNECFSEAVTWNRFLIKGIFRVQVCIKLKDCNNLNLNIVIEKNPCEINVVINKLCSVDMRM